MEAMKTRLAICLRKARYPTAAAAHLAAAAATITLHPYRCDRGDHYHLTSRTKGKRVPRASSSIAAIDAPLSGGSTCPTGDSG